MKISVRTRNVGASALLVFNCGASFANPEVQSLQLISSTPIDATHSDDAYLARVQVDAVSYIGARLTVSSKARTSQVVQATATLGDIDAGTYVKSSSFTIRQNRAVLLRQEDLIVQFSGTRTGLGLATNSPSDVRIGAVAFLEQSGRLGHEGFFPLQSGNPVSGTRPIIRAQIFGRVASATYAFVSTSGAVLFQAPLVAADPGDSNSSIYVGLATIPTQPFRIRVTAGQTGVRQSAIWTSGNLFHPATFFLKLVPDTAYLAPGQSTNIAISLNSVTAAGAFTVRLSVPTGLTADIGQWTTQLSAGGSVVLTTSITATAASGQFLRFPVEVQASPSTLPTNTETSTLEFIVQ